MTVWIFVATIAFGSTTLDMADGLKYAFARKEACEYAIAKSKDLKCIELKLIP